MNRKNLFEPIRIGRFHAKNRFVRSATKEELCNRDGNIPEELYAIYQRFIDGGVGCIIVSSARVRLFDGTDHGGLLRLDNPELLPEYKRLAALGKKSNTTMLIQATYTHRNIDELTLEDMDGIVEDFVNAALFAQAAGFDGIQIHEAHTVFMSYMLSPVYNHRTDEYGKNKNLLAQRVLTAIRKNTRDDFIIINKINCQDFMEHGLTEEDSLAYCKELEKLGLDAIEVSGNLVSKKMKDKSEESYYWKFASKLRKEVAIPVMLVGGNKSLDVMEELHMKQGIDMFSLSRGLTCEPDLIHRWQSGDESPAICKFCNACLQTYAHACIFRIKKEAKEL